MNVSRREAYLLVWGVGYFILGVLFAGSEGTEAAELFRALFILAGMLAAVGSVTQRLLLDRLAFASLAGAAAARGLWHYLSGIEGALLAGTLWIAVALAQLIVAGWPDISDNGDAGTSK